jgi:hypothetical protein
LPPARYPVRTLAIDQRDADGRRPGVGDDLLDPPLELIERLVRLAGFRGECAQVQDEEKSHAERASHHS